MNGSGEAGSIEVLVVEDHGLVRAGYRRLLEAAGGIRVAAEAETGEDAYRLYGARGFDLVLLDLTLPGMSGLELARRLLGRDRGARILACSMHEEASFVERALQAGIAGYVSKRSLPEVLVEAVKTVAGGSPYLSEDIAARLHAHRRDGEPRRLQTLSPREFEIFRLIAEGRTVAEIAELLSLSTKTVANYNTHIRKKLNTPSAAELARVAVRHGIVGD